MTRRKDLSDLTAHRCMSPGCREKAAVVKYSPDRRGRMHTRTLCASCASRVNPGHFFSAATRMRERKAA